MKDPPQAPPRPSPRYRAPRHRGKLPSVHDDLPRGFDVPPMREPAPSSHEIELEEENAELRADLHAEITKSHIIGPPTSTPPELRFLQKKLWLLLAWGLGISGSTAIAILTGVAVKACAAHYH